MTKPLSTFGSRLQAGSVGGAMALVLFGHSLLASDPVLAQASDEAAAYPVSVTLIPNPRTDLTYARDVAPILQENCVRCHRPGSVAPMSLETYPDARRWAARIAERVVKRQMPPWPVDMSVGVTDFKNDPSLTDEEIRTIADWAASGAVMGNDADLPEPIVWPDERKWEFQDELGPPDMVLQSPIYTVVADGSDKWPTPITPLEESQVAGERLTKDRWIRAVAVRPHTFESRYVFHHANPGLIMPGEAVNEMEAEGRAKLIDSAVGTEGRIFPDDQGRLIRPGSDVSWALHYHPYERDIDAALQVAVWLYPDGYEPRFYSMGDVQMQTSMTSASGEFTPRSGARDSSGRLHDHSDVIIPPNSVTTVRGVHVLDRPAVMHSIRGHMHMRGKYHVLEAIYPDGRWEVINKLNWDHGWHTLFLYEDHAMPLFPKGTVLIMTSTFDNTEANPYNPDPDQWVTGGDRSVDEMGHIRLGLTYFETEEEYQSMVDERERLLERRAVAAAGQQQGQQ